MVSIIFMAIIAVFVIVSVINAVSRISKRDGKKGSYDNKKPAFAPQKSEGVDLADEIKKSFAPTFSPKTSKVSDWASRDRIYAEEKHSHPYEEGNTLTEKAYIENSMEGESMEGCRQHYYERAVSLPDEENFDNGINKELARIIVLGEALNNPPHKKYRRK